MRYRLLVLVSIAALVGACGDGAVAGPADATDGEVSASDVAAGDSVSGGAADVATSDPDVSTEPDGAADGNGTTEDAGPLADVGPDTAAETADASPDTVGDAAPDETPDDTSDAAPEVGPDPIDVPSDPNCENTNALYCGLPWPSSRWLVPDDTTVTGYRLVYEAEAAPETVWGDTLDTTPYERLDGFSPNSQIITLFEEPADVAGLAYYDSIALSLEPDHATQLIDLETGEAVAHWVENDARAESPDETLFYIRPASRLKPDRAYGVAITGLVGLSGAPLEPGAAFAALRDGTPTTSQPIEARREAFEALFEGLEEAGIERAGLQAAWTFHTGSDHAIQSRMLALREDALGQLGPEGIGCTVTSVDEGFKGGARRIQGTVSVPWYLDAPLPPATFVLGDDGLPAFQGTEEIAFTAIVPPSRLTAAGPGPLVTWGHGLFGEAKSTVSNQAVVDVADEMGVVIVATDWHGMSNKDLPFLATVLADTSQFYLLGENLQQGMINVLTLTRSMLGACRELPELASDLGDSVIDPTRSYFLGGSQGSILGAAALALTPDTERGALIVGGAAFSFMIERSTHFNKFEAFLTPTYESRLATGSLMALSQHVWDDAETGAWIGAAASGLSGESPKRFVYLVAHNDPQVSNLSADIAARTVDLPVVSGSTRTPWGLDVVDGPVDGSAYVTFDLGDPATPEGNLSPDVDTGGHGAVGFTDPAREMISHFFETGEVIVTCAPDCTLTD